MNSTNTPSALLGGDLSPEEFQALDDFLGSPALEDTSMDVSMLEGFFATLALSSRMTMPGEWMPWVWDSEHGKVEPEFEGMDHANQIVNLLMRFYNAVVGRINTDVAGFEPIFFGGPQWDANEWCRGFLTAMRLDPEGWAPTIKENPDWFAPFFALGIEEAAARLADEADGGRRFVDAIVPSLKRIHANGMAQRAARPTGLVTSSFPMGGRVLRPTVREAAKVGRNQPCPCGSGKKYKRCCGADA